jgi:hypothetical protein
MARAHGDHRPDSDYDIAVFIKDPGSFSDESAHLAEISTDILFATGAVISATPFPGRRISRTHGVHARAAQGRPRPMKAETADYLHKACACLADATQIATLPLPHVAAREAYIAVFHAAEAYIFEHTGKVAKTHRGARTEFAGWPGASRVSHGQSLMSLA